jgi:hypothetical protein
LLDVTARGRQCSHLPSVFANDNRHRLALAGEARCIRGDMFAIAVNDDGQIPARQEGFDSFE